MKKVLNRVLSVVLSLVMCVSVLNLTVFAADGTPDTEPDTQPSESVEVVEEHTHNSTVKDEATGKTYKWVCVEVYGNTGDCTLTEHTHHSKDCVGAELVCGLREHEHTDACYTEVEVAPAEPAEGEEAAEPTTERVLSCVWKDQPSHPAHTDDCYVCPTPLHTHGEGCQFQQEVTGYRCTKTEVQAPEVTETGKLPEKTPGGNGQVGDDYKNSIYVYVEPDSIADAGFDSANQHGYKTVAKIDITEDLREAYNKANPNSGLASNANATNLTAEQFNALVKFALKYGYGKDNGGNEVKVDSSKIDATTFVYVKNSNGATDFVGSGNLTVHADGHVHQLVQSSTDATCTQGGNTTYVCSKEIGKEYTYDDQGNKTEKPGTGEKCGYTRVEYTPALGHDFSTSTWTNNGDGTHSKQCSRCAEKMTQAHNWVEKSAWTEWTEVEGDPTTLERTRVLKCADGCGVADKTESQTKKLGQYVLTYVCKAGDEVIGSGTVGAFYPGEDYSQGAPAITGYTATTGTQTGKMPSKDDVLTFVYTVKEYTLTINYLYASTNTVAAAQYTGTVAYKANYSVASPTVTDYTTTTTTVSGTMPADDVVVNVYYSAIPVPPTPPTPPTPPEQEIDEPDVPLVEEPDVDIEEPEVPLVEEPEIEIEIDEPDVPLADVPETGDGSGLWFMSAVLSAMGLALLFFTRKREGQEG